MNRLLATLPLLMLGGALVLPGCRPPEDLDRGGAPKLGELSESRRGSPPPRQGPGEDGAGEPGDGGDEGPNLSNRGLGKEDYALIEAELRCVRGQFKDDAAALDKAQAAILDRYGAQEDWVERVRAHLNGEPDVANRLEDMIGRRMGNICKDGTISPELIEPSGAAPAAGNDAPPADGGDAPPAEGDAAPADGGDAAPADAPPEDAPSTPPDDPTPSEGGAGPE